MGQDQLNQGAQSNPRERPGLGAPRFTTAKVMERVRLKLALRRIEQATAQPGVGARVEASRPLPRWQSAVPRFESKAEYKLAELLRFDDVDFIDAAYRALLQRGPDAVGHDKYLAVLRDGHVRKVEILGSIRFSEEGRQRGVHVDGLLLPYKLHQWRHKRFVGPLLGFVLAVIRLPRLALNLQVMATRSARDSRELGDLVNRCGAIVDQRSADVDRVINDLGARLTKLDSLSVEMARAVVSRLESLDQALVTQEQHNRELATRLHQLESAAAQDQRSLQALLDRVTVFMNEAVRGPHDNSGAREQGESVQEARYVSFEDAFRGERGEIKKRVAHYLDKLKKAGIEAGDGLVLDLGSGRGEWLEVLTEQGYACRGVDLNHGMLKESRERGHDVVESDALGYLRTLDNGSVAAITSMHLIEYLPHPLLIALLDESLRVLRPGGVLILETSNPENVRVGSCQFYMDPTRLHPIPPLLLQWVVRSRGFADPIIEHLGKHHGMPNLLPVSSEIPGARQINQMIAWFTAPPDYAVIACKPLTA